MGLFDFIKRVLFGPPRSGIRHVPGPPGICPYCGSGLLPLFQDRCFACGHDWQDLNNVVRHAPSNVQVSIQTQAAGGVMVSEGWTVSPQAGPRSAWTPPTVRQGESITLSNLDA